MYYTLNQLNIFLKIVETESITKASEELRLTQPAVSIQLRNLQNQFDIPLTEVIGRKIHITEFGKEIAVLANKILAQVNEINGKTMAYKGLLAGKLKISVVSTGKYVIPYFLADFMRANPGVELAIDVTNKLKVLESLEHNEVDLALVSILPLHLQVEKMDLLQNKLYFVGNMERKLHRNETFKDLIQSVPMIYRESGSGTRQVMERYIEKNKFSISKKMELTSNEAVKQALVAGLGYSVMPLIGIKNELFNKELQIIPAKGLPIKTTWSLIWLKGKRHSPVSMAFLNYIKMHRSQIVHEKFSWYEQF